MYFADFASYGTGFAESSMSNLQSVSIIAAFPFGAVMILIVAGFLKDAGKYLKENEKKE